MINITFMSSKDFPPSQKSGETTPEVIPTKDQVFAVLKRFLEGRGFSEVRTRTDEKGLYLWDVKIKKEDGEEEYSYMRKGRYPEGEASKTAIHVMFYDADGMPTPGDEVARLVAGEWRFFDVNGKIKK